jgi:hypothetical protein
VWIAQNREYLDWWLMQKFPGRTLEELDDVDWLRLQRAMEVGRLVDIEQRHGLIAEGKLKPEAFNAREWAQVRRNTALYDALEAERTGSDGGG